jgi:hypothetical protein
MSAHGVFRSSTTPELQTNIKRPARSEGNGRNLGLPPAMSQPKGVR